MIRGFVLAVFIIFIAANINGINSFLSVQTDKTVEFGHSVTVVPQSWNTTEELNMTNQSKTPSAIANGYVIIDIWDDWPEANISSVSEKKFKSMENGSYKVLKNENATMTGVPVSKQYFTNPSRDNNITFNHIGANYVFAKEDSNYAIQIHYFTESDYNDSAFLRELDDRTEDIMSNIHNNEYNGFFSGIRDIYNFFVDNLN